MNMNATNCEPRPAATWGRYSAKQTRHQVNFRCHAPQAGSVQLVGDFNDWNLAANPMRLMPDGWWMTSLELSHGHHQYLFVVDGKPMLDPKASGIARNGNNDPVSLIAVS